MQFFPFACITSGFVKSNKTANRGQCVTKYRGRSEASVYWWKRDGWGQQVGRMGRGGAIVGGVIVKWETANKAVFNSAYRIC